MTALDARAREAIKDSGLTIAAYTRYWFPDEKWHGDACGCTDDRCKGFHHDFTDECGCLAVQINEVRDANHVPGSLHRLTPHHEHGVQSFYDDGGDVECCICPGTPCAAVTVADMLKHADYDRASAERRGQFQARQQISDAIAKCAPPDRPLDRPDRAYDAAVEAFQTCWVIARGNIDEPPF